MATTINYSGNVSRGGKSSVNVVRYTGTTMKIWFRDRGGNQATYIYYSKDIGRSNLSRMKELAKAGRGLNSYLHQHRIKGKRA